MTDAYAPTADDVFDMLEELPPPIQTAVISMLVSLKVSWRCTWTVYDRIEFEMLQASGLFEVRFNEGGSVTVRANALTEVLQADKQRALMAAGVRM
jgi:hypothetical protein